MKYINFVNKASLGLAVLLSLTFATPSAYAAETSKTQSSKQTATKQSAPSPSTNTSTSTGSPNPSNATTSPASIDSSSQINSSVTNTTTGTAMSDAPKVSEFVWNELATRNLQASKDFYGKVFDWKFTEHPIGDMTYTMVNTNGKEFAGIWSIPKEQEAQIQPHWLSYILVANVDQSLEKALKHGATLIKPATAIGDFGRMAIIKDPSGAHVALWQALKNKM